MYCKTFPLYICTTSSSVHSVQKKIITFHLQLQTVANMTIAKMMYIYSAVLLLASFPHELMGWNFMAKASTVVCHRPLGHGSNSLRKSDGCFIFSYASLASEKKFFYLCMCVCVHMNVSIYLSIYIYI